MRAALVACLALLFVTACRNPVTTTSGGDRLGSVVTPPMPGPSIDSISPSSATAGSGDVSVTIIGSNFINIGIARRSFVVWFTTDAQQHVLPATFVNVNRLTVTIPSTLLATVGTAKIVVMNGDVMNFGYAGYPQSDPKTFEVRPPPH